VKIIKFQAEQKGLYIETKELGTIQQIVLCDELRMRQVLINLLTNAIKFTSSGTITIDCYMKENLLCIAITDTGIGIKECDIGRLFRDFSRLEDSKELNPSGTGLGLSLCKNLMQIMNGSISLHSDYGVGSTFTISIPSACLTRDASYTVIPDEKNSVEKVAPLFINPGRKIQNISLKSSMTLIRIPTVLIVDDNVYNLYALKSLLTSLNILCDTAYNGKEAAELVRKKKLQNYSLVLMDLEMPIMDGLEATKLINSMHTEGKIPQIKIIGLTAHSPQTVYDECKKVGMEDVLSKPITKAELIRVIKQ
jgi:CheY-like chemotaxis protein